MKSTRTVVLEMEAETLDWLEGRHRELMHVLRWQRDDMPMVVSDNLPSDHTFASFLAFLLKTGARVIDSGITRTERMIG
jgi:hypothetical protein